jgi:predicted SnoaL-like aldol condensation-catalyzing enzyme
MTTNHRIGARKAAAVSFLSLAASGRVTEAFRAHVGEGFRHHNPFFRGDAGSLMAAMQANAAQNPEKILNVLHSLEDGDLVAVHSHVRQKPDDRGAVVVHVFRFADDRIVELWDVAQPLPETSPNEYGML